MRWREGAPATPQEAGGSLLWLWILLLCIGAAVILIILVKKRTVSRRAAWTGRHATNWEELPRGGPPLIWDDLIQFISVETGRRGALPSGNCGCLEENGWNGDLQPIILQSISCFLLGRSCSGCFLCIRPSCSCLCFGRSATTFYRRAGRVRASSFRRFAFLHDFLLNPVFNTRGDTVLFTCFGGRPYTLEALGYGLSTGSMFLTVVLWFSCYHVVMTSDKFLYLFGRFLPAVSMLLCMVLRFVPNLKAKAETIGNARRCIGKSPTDGTKREGLEHGTEILSVLTSWALEGAVVTADSMRSRGLRLRPQIPFFQLSDDASGLGAADDNAVVHCGNRAVCGFGRHGGRLFPN